MTCDIAEPSWRRAAALFVIAVAAGCATAPAERYDAQAERLGFEREVVRGTLWRHAVFVNRSGVADAPLHVYLESDGSPWQRATRVAADPTPVQPVALRLMRLDGAPSVLIGRPCYHGVTGAVSCHPRLWTHERYSSEVVDSMAAAVEELIRRTRSAGIVLIGYSGGGVLAMLLAERIPRTRAVVTVAANLDVRGWTEQHGYSPLHGSLDPAARPPLAPAIAQLHVAGGNDRNVSAGLITRVLQQQRNASLRIVAQADHVCCWEQEWPSVLRWIDANFE